MVGTMREKIRKTVEKKVDSLVTTLSGMGTCACLFFLGMHVTAARAPFFIRKAATGTLRGTIDLWGCVEE